MVKLIIGLGNPGDKYDKTRHNAGFMVVDSLFDKYSFNQFNDKFHGVFAKGEIGNSSIILLKPHTFMNLSGRSAQECAHFFKIPIEDIIVIHDELDLELGRVKIKIGGSNAGHNGLKSLDENIGNGYTRLRFGIDRPEFGSSSSYVLSNFSKEEEPLLCECIKSITNNFEDLIKGKAPEFANKFALDIKEFKEKI
jgi:PTH1 family peptidyl-tRNA hydrolase